MKILRVSFFGHREVNNFRYVESELVKIVDSLLDREEYIEFCVGMNGEFDALATSVIRRERKRYDDYHNSCLILVLPYPKAGEEFYKKSYDEIEYPVGKETHFKAAIGERNKRMIESSDLVVVNCNKKKGGAYNAYNYARKLNKAMILIAYEES